MSAKAKARLTQLADRFSENRKSDFQMHEKEAAPRPIEAHRPHGQKRDFVKVCVTLPPEVYAGLAAEVTRRKVSKMANAQLSAVMREAAVVFLQS